MKTHNKNPEAVSRLTPEQYRVTQRHGTEQSYRSGNPERLLDRR
ncbi:hypothetical protein [Rhizobium jaguaris]|nr:hypothetical protein [Rhizobium jaguaris]